MKNFFALVSDWRECHKWHTIRFAAILAVLSLVAASLPELAENIPARVYHWIAFGLAMAIGIGRLLNQGGNDAPPLNPENKPAPGHL